jgi:hypothetical protein
MLSAILKWLSTLLKEDELCIAQADALAFEVMALESSDPNYTEKLTKLTTFVNSCKHLRDRDDYQTLLEGFELLGQSNNHHSAA